MSEPILTIGLAHETDVVLARQRARQIAGLLEFDTQDQTRIATAVSEIARNAFRYARGGKVTFALEGVTVPQLLTIEVTDRGGGIADLQSVLEGRYRSDTGMGLGIVGTKRLMDHFTITSSSGGTTVRFGKFVPRSRGLVRSDALAGVTESLARLRPTNAVDEIQRQNQELLGALEELSQRQDELVALNHELEDTNRGVVALYAELDERADHLRRADEVKSKFLSNMSHEFRTPVNSIMALARMLLDRTDGDLSEEQERQVRFINDAATSLSELVNDLLDLAKAQAGKVVVHPVEFEVGNLFSALRGMLRPLLLDESVSLVFEEPEAIPLLFTDESKVSQILRNFVSNALKFTERGEVRVSARLLDGDTIAFAVRDTGLGIAPEDHERIFQEFTQLDSPVQLRVKGTGLGLPLCRRLAELLGGAVTVESAPGEGSTFTAIVPIHYETPTPVREWEVDASRIRVLVVEDRPEMVMLYERYLAEAGYQPIIARTLREAREAIVATTPHAMILDIMLRGEDSWEFLAELKRRPDTAELPVMVVSAVADERKALALGADAHLQKPVERDRLLGVLRDLTRPRALHRILVVDDEEISRYVLRQHLAGNERQVVEAGSGAEALRRARDDRPDVVCLDLGMPDLDGFEVLRRLKADPDTSAIPVVVVTARELTHGERTMLDEMAAGVLSKHTVSRESTLAMIAAVAGRGG